MGDISLARQKFEQKRSSLQSREENGSDLVQLMLAYALFEEAQNQVAKARKIYENVTQVSAQGLLNAQLAFIAFEMRASNSDRAKELFAKAFENALRQVDSHAVAFLCMKYARFLAFKCSDVQMACDIMERATSVIKNSKVLYLSQLNLLRHLEGFG